MNDFIFRNSSIELEAGITLYYEKGMQKARESSLEKLLNGLKSLMNNINCISLPNTYRLSLRNLSDIEVNSKRRVYMLSYD